MATQQEITIAVVGDVHDQWDAVGDRQALMTMGADLVLFVGDFGNEALDIVEQVARLPLPKAVILGNHDAWYTASSWGRKKAPYDHHLEDRVQAQYDLLGAVHVGYSYLDIPELELSVVGGRPFSWGGDTWRNEDFYKQRYGVMNFEDSANLIKAQLARCRYPTIIFLGHNGPTGLGDRPEDICGRDWQPLGGDHGDPDFTQAIAAAKAMEKKIALVTFGHMHHSLRHRKDLRRCRSCFQEDTLYLNAAVVPRHKEDPKSGDRHHSIAKVTLRDQRAQQAELCWVNPTRNSSISEVLWSAH